jgi:hypothetical protein
MSLGHLADALIFSNHLSVCFGAILDDHAAVAAAIAYCGAQS